MLVRKRSPGFFERWCNKPMSSIADMPMSAPAVEGVLEPLSVTVPTARRISGLGNTTIWGLIKDRKLETVHIGRRTLITYRSLVALLAPQTGPQPRPGCQRRRKTRSVDGV